MNNTPLSTTLPEIASSSVAPAFVCDCGEDASSACQGEPFFREHEGKQYCVLHYPDKDKLEAFRVSFNRKLEAEDFDFRGVWFPEEASFDHVKPVWGDAIFVDTTFSGRALFRYVRFSKTANFTRATFAEKADFNGAKFGWETCFLFATFNRKANFENVIFSEGMADFRFAKFSEKADFRRTKFGEKADFRYATFNEEASFIEATFDGKADFSSVTFKDYVRFTQTAMTGGFGKYSCLDLQFAHIEKPDRFLFHTLVLHPHWFTNVDPRKFEFTDIKWDYELKEELRRTEVSASHRLLAITFRQLADNAEANHRYQEASNFRYNAFEARRIEKFWGFVPWRLDWWYWLASGYGERVRRAFVVFVALFALFAFGYGRVGFDQSGKATTQPPTVQTDTVGKPLDWKDACLYSIGVGILQKPDPKPLTRAARTLVYLQTVLGPAQAALLALAVRRRFMR